MSAIITIRWKISMMSRCDGILCQLMPTRHDAFREDFSYRYRDLNDEDSAGSGEPKSVPSREKKGIATRSKKRRRTFYKRLLPKKFRSGKEREIAKGRNRMREREAERRRGRRLTSTFSCVRSAGAMFVLGNAITLSYKI